MKKLSIVLVFIYSTAFGQNNLEPSVAQYVHFTTFNAEQKIGDLYYLNKKFSSFDTLPDAKKVIQPNWIGTLPAPNYTLFAKAMDQAESNTKASLRTLQSYYIAAYQKDTALFEYCRKKGFLKSKAQKGKALVNTLYENMQAIRTIRSSILDAAFATAPTNDTSIVTSLYYLLHREEQFLIGVERNLSKTNPNRASIPTFQQSAADTKQTLAGIKRNGEHSEALSKLLKTWQRWYAERAYANKTYSPINEQYSTMQQNEYREMTAMFNKVIKAYNIYGNEGAALKYPSFVPRLFLETKKVRVSVPITPAFTLSPYSTPQIVEKRKKLDSAQIALLNAYIQASNAITKSRNNTLLRMHHFQNSINTIKQSPWWEYKNKPGPAFVYYHHLSDSGVLQLLPKTTLLFPEYHEAFKAIVDSHSAWLKTTQGFSEELAGYSINQPYANGDFERAEAIFNLCNLHFDAYDQIQNRLQELVQLIYTSNAGIDPQNPWVKSSTAMASVLFQSSNLMGDMKTILYHELKHPILVATLDSALTQYTQSKDENLRGITRMDPHRSNNPDYLYYRIGKSNAQLLTQFTKLKNLSPNNAYGSNRSMSATHFISNYQNAVKHHNTFVDMASGVNTKFQPKLDQNRPVYLLYSFFATDYRLFNSVATRMAKPQNSNQKALYSTATETSAILRDTVYIQTILRDTVYIAENSTLAEHYAHNNLVFLMDVSASMRKKDKLPMLKKALTHLSGQMRWQDDLALVAYSGKAVVVLPPTSASEQKKLNKAIKKLQPGGSTNSYLGLKLAYAVADNNYKRQGNNKVIIATDGAIKYGKKLEALVGEFAKNDIGLTIFSFGEINAEMEKNLKQLASFGNGNYQHITLENADAILLEEAKKERR